MQKTESVDAVIFIECETRLGFTLPWAGVTPAPSTKKRCGTSSLLEVSKQRRVRLFTSPVIFTGEAAGRNAAGR